MADKVKQPRMHARYEKAEKELFALVVGEKPEFSEIYLVIAPTKAGKTFLMARMIEAVEAYVVREGKSDPSRVPTISQQLSSPVRGGFDYSLMYRQDLKQLLPHARNLLDKELPAAVTHGLIERGTIVSARDEGHHLLNVSSGAADQDRMVNQLDALKVVVNESRVRLVLFGGAKLAKACMINSHFKSRAHTIIIGAYDGSIKADRNEFHRLVQEAMVEYKVVGYKSKDFDTTVTIMNRVQGLIGWFWESIEKSKRMHKENFPSQGELFVLKAPGVLQGCELFFRNCFIQVQQ